MENPPHKLISCEAVFIFPATLLPDIAQAQANYVFRKEELQAPEAVMATNPTNDPPGVLVHDRLPPS